MKRRIKIFPICMALAITVCALTACNPFGVEDDNRNLGDSHINEDMSDEEMLETIDNGIAFEEEAEGAELKIRDAKREEFIGAWEATSGQSIYMYGNVQLDIKENGRFTGNIADEDVSGTWTFKENSALLDGDFFTAKLSFNKNGNLVMQEDRSGEDDASQYINTVLTKK